MVFGPFSYIFEGGWLEGRVLLSLGSALGMMPNSEFLVERVTASLFALALPPPELLLIRGGLVLHIPGCIFDGCFRMFDEVVDIVEIVVAEGIEYGLANLIAFLETVEFFVFLLTFAI